MEDFEVPTAWQRAVVDLLLTVVPSNGRYVEQAAKMLVRMEGEESQFAIHVPGLTVREGARSHCLSLGEYRDGDGFIVCLGLHEQGGVLDLFERYKTGPQLMELEPPISKISVWENGTKRPS